jgi:hypothetical protein
MSTRTILELNHDHIARMTAEDWEDIKQMCLHYPDLDGRYRQVNGVKVLFQRHHSTDVTLKTKYQEIKL